MRVSAARKAANVKYPAMYATGEDQASIKFNCAQRAHYNTLENLPVFLTACVLSHRGCPEALL